MKLYGVLGGILIMSLGVAGCVAEAEDVPDEAQAQEPEPELSEISSQITVGGHYCVSQSYASAERLDGNHDVCWRSPSWFGANGTRLSQGHKVTAVRSCGGFSSAYAVVYSHWNQRYYYMRKDAFSPC